jgi:signal transduction histidine kinase/CheY-like chemotaxis protein
MFSLSSRIAQARAISPTELEQNWIRFAIAILVQLYLVVSAVYDRTITNTELGSMAIAGSFMILMFGPLMWLLAAPAFTSRRIYTCIAMDNFFISVLLAILGTGGYVLYGLYLWVAIGNGFRFGRWYLHCSQAAAVAGFMGVVAFDSFWQEHLMLSFALLVLIGAVPYYAGIMASRLQQTNAQLLEATAAATRATRAKSAFMAAASHDLRQPMTALSLYAEALKLMLDNSKDAHGLLNGIEMSVQHLERLFDGLLDMSQLESGALQPSFVAFPVMPMLSRLVGAERVVAEIKGVELRLVGTSVSVWSDPVLLERIVKNLLANAIRYTMKGKIVIGCRRRAQGQIDICIGDSGIGIPESEMEKIFDDFYRVTTGVPHGLGLGLSIVKNVAKLLGHEVLLASIPGRGTMFSVRLARSTGLVPMPVDGPAPLISIAGKCVAVIDDDLEIRRGLLVLLHQWQCDAIVAGTWDELDRALKSANKRPDALIADYRLADERSGIEVIQEMRRRYGKKLPCMLISGTTNVSELNVNLADIVVASKPVPVQKLRAFLQQTPPLRSP